MALDFATVYDEHVGHVYGFLAYRLSDIGVAEDLTQATFERAFRAWPRYDPTRAQPSTWLLAIARNVLIDHFRSASHRRTVDVPDADLDVLGPATQAPELPAEIPPELSAALATLGERDREILALRFGADFSGPEIAEVTQLSLANVQQILSRSLRKLRAELERSGFDRGG
jgi:RNA polymerase sigma-70 factor (ECF subfamily)